VDELRPAFCLWRISEEAQILNSIVVCLNDKKGLPFQ
jgi:hypothetical protein